MSNAFRREVLEERGFVRLLSDRQHAPLLERLDIEVLRAEGGEVWVPDWALFVLRVTRPIEGGFRRRALCAARDQERLREAIRTAHMLGKEHAVRSMLTWELHRREVLCTDQEARSDLKDMRLNVTVDGDDLTLDDVDVGAVTAKQLADAINAKSDSDVLAALDGIDGVAFTTMVRGTGGGDDEP